MSLKLINAIFFRSLLHFRDIMDVISGMAESIMNNSLKYFIRQLHEWYLNDY